MFNRNPCVLECPPEEGSEGTSVFARIVAAIREADGVVENKTPASSQVILSTRKVPFVDPYQRGIVFKISACGHVHICGHEKSKKRGRRFLCMSSCVSKCVETSNGHVISSLYFEPRLLTETRAHRHSWTSWPESPWMLESQSFPPPFPPVAGVTAMCCHVQGMPGI